MGNGIGELSESSLHNQLKHHYYEEGDILECQLEGYYIDVRKPNELVEIQTSSFGSIKTKYRKLLRNGHVIRMVYPVAHLKWLVKTHRGGRIEKRKSPKMGTVYDAFTELVSIPQFLKHPKFIFEIVITEEEEYRIHDGKGSWRRRGWSISDHKLKSITRTYSFADPSDFQQILPNNLPEEFTTEDLANLLKIPKWLAQKMTYTLKKIGCINQIGKKSRYNLYRLSKS